MAPKATGFPRREIGAAGVPVHRLSTAVPRNGGRSGGVSVGREPGGPIDALGGYDQVGRFGPLGVPKGA